MVAVAHARSANTPAYARVPRDFPGGTILCVASGPSLTQADVDYCRGRVDAAIAVNTSYERCAWAYALYAADSHWWGWHKGARGFEGMRYSVSTEASRYGVSILRNTGKDGLELSPDGLKTGLNSGFSAINLAVHLGAKRIVLLGYDLQPGAKLDHWHPNHPHGRTSPYALFREKFTTLVQPLAALGIEVVNCSRSTALKCFPCLPLECAL